MIFFLVKTLGVSQHLQTIKIIYPPPQAHSMEEHVSKGQQSEFRGLLSGGKFASCASVEVYVQGHLYRKIG